jgi:hypothetical protein
MKTSLNFKETSLPIKVLIIFMKMIMMLIILNYLMCIDIMCYKFTFGFNCLILFLTYTYVLHGVQKCLELFLNCKITESEKTYTYILHSKTSTFNLPLLSRKEVSFLILQAFYVPLCLCVCVYVRVSLVRHLNQMTSFYITCMTTLPYHINIAS